jgi:hypothetical protein
MEMFLYFNGEILLNWFVIDEPINSMLSQFQPDRKLVQ